MTKLMTLSLMLALLTGPLLAEASEIKSKLIPEAAVKTASARLYSDILSRACRNGWRYPRASIENGFRRHFEELRLQLIDHGYTVLPGTTTNAPHVQTTKVSNKRQLVRSRQFGCSQYWLDE